jgi:hypothetical protein
MQSLSALAIPSRQTVWTARRMSAFGDSFEVMMGRSYWS